MWLTATNKSYDFAFTKEAHGVPGRFHHVTFALDSREAILQAADVFLRRRLHRDRAAQARGAADLLPLRLRAGRQPRGGGRRRARLVLAPDWKPITWTQAERARARPGA